MSKEQIEALKRELNARSEFHRQRNDAHSTAVYVALMEMRDIVDKLSKPTSPPKNNP